MKTITLLILLLPGLSISQTVLIWGSSSPFCPAAPNAYKRTHLCPKLDNQFLRKAISDSEMAFRGFGISLVHKAICSTTTSK